jgi:tetratricopeptide (TPR) repeat protein
MMTQETIYKDLWCKDDKFVQKIVADTATPAVLRAMGLFIIREYEKAKGLVENNPEINPDDVVYQELKLYFDLSKDKNADLSLYKQKAEALIDKAPWLIYARLLLGNILERQKHFEEADKYFREVLASCPSNVVALAGMIRILIHKREFGQALSALQTKSKSALEGLNLIKRRGWQSIFLAYRLLSYWGEKKILRLMFVLIVLYTAVSAFLPPVFLVFPGTVFLFFSVLSFYFFRKDPLVFSMCFTATAYIPGYWLLGLLLKLIVHFILLVIIGS